MRHRIHRHARPGAKAASSSGSSRDPWCSPLSPLLLVLAFAGHGLAEGPTTPVLHFPDGERPEVLGEIDLRGLGLQAFAIGPAGRRAAIAVDGASGDEIRSEIRVYDLDTPESVTIPVRGVIRDLLFLAASEDLYAIEHRPAKKREGESFLVTVELVSRKIRREMRLPRSALGLEYWPGGRSLIVPVRNELRTITLPLLRSGPLFRLPGENLAVAVAGGTRVLVGQDTAVVVVDLSDPQGRDSIPVRERLEVSQATVALALSADGSRGLARLADDRVMALTLDPLRMEEIGTGIVAVPRAVTLAPPVEPVAPRSPYGSGQTPDRSPPRPEATPPPEVPSAPVADAGAIEAEAAPGPEPASRPDSPTPPAHAPAAAPVESAETSEVGVSPEEVERHEDIRRDPVKSPPPSEAHRSGIDVGAPVEAAESPLASTPAPGSTPSPDEAEPPSEEPAGISAHTTSAPPTIPADATEGSPALREGAGVQVRGRIGGTAASLVVAVVLFGPDGALGEAARVRPAPDGTYAVTGLSRGRYRVQLDGGGKRVLISRPQVHIVQVSDGQVAVADFDVVRGM